MAGFRLDKQGDGPVRRRGDQGRELEMAIGGVVRTWADEAALGVQRATSSRGALAALVDDAEQSREITRAVRSGSSWDDPFDAVIDMARSGSSGLYDAWTAAKAAGTIFERAASKHAGGNGQVLLQNAATRAGKAGEAVEAWISGPRRGSLAELQETVRPLLEAAREAGERAARLG